MEFFPGAHSWVSYTKVIEQNPALPTNDINGINLISGFASHNEG